MIRAAVFAICLPLAMLALALLALYAIRWYDLSIRGFDPLRPWTGWLSGHFGRPVRTFVAEFLYCMVNAFFLVVGYVMRLFGRRSSIPSGKNAVQGAPLVVLIHGLMSTGANMWIMKLRLNMRGIRNIAVYDYESTKGTVELQRDKLRDFLATAHQQTGAEGVAFIAHSMGGVIAHDYACQYGEAWGGTLALVTTGSPMRGSRLAAFGLSAAARALHPENPYFTQLGARRPQAPFVCIGSVYDELVIPYTNSSHPLADRFELVDTCGHAGLIYNGRAFGHVMEALRSALPDEAGSECESIDGGLPGHAQSGKI
ncbi:MAG: alpha/beta hydrolase [Nitrospinota bacterium]|nr:alpha/beta hydrolase [Nitrospinota bacterium]